MENKQMTLNEIVESKGFRIFMKKLEIISAILLCIALAVKFSVSSEKVHFVGLLLTLSLQTMAIISFFTAFYKFESESKILSLLFYKIYGLGLSLGFVYVLFVFQKWPIAAISIIISLSLIIISLFLGLREKIGENKNRINWLFFTRIVVLVFLILLINISN